MSDNPAQLLREIHSLSQAITVNVEDGSMSQDGYENAVATLYLARAVLCVGERIQRALDTLAPGGGAR